jgi:hypothetical protein
MTLSVPDVLWIAGGFVALGLLGVLSKQRATRGAHEARPAKSSVTWNDVAALWRDPLKERRRRSEIDREYARKRRVRGQWLIVLLLYASGPATFGLFWLATHEGWTRVGLYGGFLAGAAGVVLSVLAIPYVLFAPDPAPVPYNLLFFFALVSFLFALWSVIQPVAR